jgi:hypothetical protein
MAKPGENGYVEFTVSVPSRPDLPTLKIVAPDEKVAWNKYRRQVEQRGLSAEPKIERVTAAEPKIKTTAKEKKT